MGRQGEGGGLKILENEETSFMDHPLGSIRVDLYSFVSKLLGVKTYSCKILGCQAPMTPIL